MKIKILQLNIWNGRLKRNIANFLRENNFDIICLEEAVWSKNNTTEGRRQIEYYGFSVEQIMELTGLKCVVRGAKFGNEIANGLDCLLEGNVILSRFEATDSFVKNLNVEPDEKVIFTGNNYDNAKIFAYNIVGAKFEELGGLQVFCHHGFWNKDPMGNGESIRMMSMAMDAIPRDNKCPVMVCGDFNLRYDAKAMRETDFLRDLVHENNIKNTLNNLVSVDNQVDCDHILINDKIKVNSFRMCDELVSDHYAIITEIEV